MTTLEDETRYRAATQAQTVKSQNAALLRPPEKKWWQKMGDFFWDRKRKMCLTRTPVNWIAISIYYSFFVAGVILIFYISMMIADAVASRESNRPQYVLSGSWIGSTPSANFFPIESERNLIWLSDQYDYNKYVSLISSEFDKYKEIGEFNVSQFDKCSEAPYGYNNRTPCLYFRINRILFWKPTPYKKGDKLPKEMPKSVKERIEKSSTPRIWISCDGATAKDRDHIKEDSFDIQGSGGFDVNAFPFKVHDDFIDPIVAIRIIHEKRDRILYEFICTLWGNKMDRNVSSVQVVYYSE